MATSGDTFERKEKKYLITAAQCAAIKEGLSALVYTQVSDVQDEVNGMLTYDRQVVKIPVEFFAEINKEFKL